MCKTYTECTFGKQRTFDSHMQEHTPYHSRSKPKEAKTVAAADITNKQLLHYNDFHYRYGVNGGIADALPGTCNPAVISPPRYS